MILKGPFNNYVDKMRGGGGQKMSVFVHAQGRKTVYAGGGVGGSKMANSVHVVDECPLKQNYPSTHQNLNSKGFATHVFQNY